MILSLMIKSLLATYCHDIMYNIGNKAGSEVVPDTRPPKKHEYKQADGILAAPIETVTPRSEWLITGCLRLGLGPRGHNFTLFHGCYPNPTARGEQLLDL